MNHLHSGAKSATHFLTAFRQLLTSRCPAQSCRRTHPHSRGSHSLSSFTKRSDNHRGQVLLQTRSQLIFGRSRPNYSSVAHEQVSSIDSSPTNLGHDSHSSALTSESQRPKEKVLLLMSGGVDSSMCAHILKNQGYDVTGLYMHNWNHDEETQDELESRPEHQQPRQSISNGNRNDTLYLKESTVISPRTSPASSETSPSTSSESSLTPRTARIRPKVCTSDRDWADVQAVCEQIGIPARRLDFSRQYWNQVFEVMLQEYENGRTPNPDVTCNREIKFGELIEWCNRNGGLGKDRHKSSKDTGSRHNSVTNGDDQSSSTLHGWDYLATGHYARVELDPITGQAKLLRALDSNKDQTYYLSTLSERVLRNVIFPLAQFDKPTVKKMAMTTGVDQLKNAAVKKESMGICFVGQRKRFGEFLKEYLDTKPGPVRVDGLDGRLIGQHKGLFRYTVGQSSGVTNGFQKWVVLRVDLPSNTLIVVDGTQNERLFSPGLIAESWHWIAGRPPMKLIQAVQGGIKPEDQDEFPYTAQIRHRQVPQPCTIEPIMDGSSGNSDLASAQLFRVRFKDLQRAIASGQQLVLYDKDECLGGGVIQSSLPPS